MNLYRIEGYCSYIFLIEAAMLCTLFQSIMPEQT